jgi:hypothetical protein
MLERIDQVLLPVRHAAQAAAWYERAGTVRANVRSRERAVARRSGGIAAAHHGKRTYCCRKGDNIDDMNNGKLPVKRIDTVFVPVRDVSRSEEWYMHMFPFRVVYRSPRAITSASGSTSRGRCRPGLPCTDAILCRRRSTFRSTSTPPTWTKRIGC